MYFYFSLLDEHIQKSALPKGLKGTVKGLVKERWEYAHSDIHSAGFCLDPEFWHLPLNQEVACPFSVMCTVRGQPDAQLTVACPAEVLTVMQLMCRYSNGLYNICGING